MHQYVESCINLISIPLIESLAARGGTLNPLSNIFYNNEKLNFLCEERNGEGCVNNPLFRQDIESDLNVNIKQGLQSCLNLNVFTEQGYRVTSGEIDVNLKIQKEDLLVEVNFPITF